MSFGESQKCPAAEDCKQHDTNQRTDGRLIELAKAARRDGEIYQRIVHHIKRETRLCAVTAQQGKETIGEADGTAQQAPPKSSKGYTNKEIGYRFREPVHLGRDKGGKQCKPATRLRSRVLGMVGT